MSSSSPFPSSGNTLEVMGTPVRNRRPGFRPSPSPEVDVWFHPPSGTSSPQPHISFPVSGTSSPYLQHTSSPYFDAKSSPLVVTDSPRSASPVNATKAGLGLSWRDASVAAARRKHENQAKSRRRMAIGGGATLVGFSLLWLLARSGVGSSTTTSSSTFKRMGRQDAPRSSPLSPLFSSAAKRTATASFRDELSTDMSYITSPQHGNLAEQIMNFYHLTHLASIMSRIPLVAPFAVSNSASEDGPSNVPFSSIFDMPRFTQQTDVYVVDWNDIRPPNADGDKLGCWIGGVSNEEMRARALAMKENGVDASFYPMHAVPAGRDGSQGGDQVLITHNFLASFEKDGSAQAGLVEQAKHSSSVSTLTSSMHTDPETHVLCLDHTLYRPEHPTTAHSTTHLDPRDHTAFHTHGKALHYVPDLQDAALDLVAFVLGHRSPFIVVHIDAQAQAAECALRNDADEDCRVPKLSRYLEAVERVLEIAIRSNGGQGKKQSREQRHQVRALSVVVSTDVTDLGFKGELAAAGWSLLDFDDLEMKQRFGQWTPEIIEGVVQSKATAFVGTRGSSVSTLAALRVRSWRQGPTELVY